MSRATNMVSLIEKDLRKTAANMVAKIETKQGKKFTEEEKEKLIQKFVANMARMKSLKKQEEYIDSLGEKGGIDEEDDNDDDDDEEDDDEDDDKDKKPDREKPSSMFKKGDKDKDEEDDEEEEEEDDESKKKGK